MTLISENVLKYAVFWVYSFSKRLCPKTDYSFSVVSVKLLGKARFVLTCLDRVITTTVLQDPDVSQQVKGDSNVSVHWEKLDQSAMMVGPILFLVDLSI